ncbi:hypothetical protein [Ligilactobacillus sp. WC1T17]
MDINALILATIMPQLISKDTISVANNGDFANFENRTIEEVITLTRIKLYLYIPYMYVYVALLMSDYVLQNKEFISFMNIIFVTEYKKLESFPYTMRCFSRAFVVGILWPYASVLYMATRNFSVNELLKFITNDLKGKISDETLESIENIKLTTDVENVFFRKLAIVITILIIILILTILKIVQS